MLSKNLAARGVVNLIPLLRGGRTALTCGRQLGKLRRSRLTKGGTTLGVWRTIERHGGTPGTLRMSYETFYQLGPPSSDARSRFPNRQ